MDHVEVIVAGAGVVGLAIARQLALQGLDVLILESEKSIGSVTSSRNSGVIHAGIYYKKDSLKALCCIEGRKALYKYLEERRIPHRKCGKIIVATDEAEKDKLLDIKSRAAASGVDDLALLSADDVRAREPHVKAVAGLFSPTTGIVDVHELMLGFLGDAQANGAMLALGTPLESMRVEKDRFVLTVGGAAPMTLSCTFLINAAGIDAQSLAHHFEGLSRPTIPPRHMGKGNYFSLSGPQPFTHLVYPVPEVGGLGIHATLDMSGQVRFGPDVEWVETVDYTVDPARGERFYAAIRRYWPGLPDGALRPDFAGIRPKIYGKGEPEADFVIQGPEIHGIANLVNLYGIESPGLTASLAIAERCRKLLEPRP